MMRSCSPKLGWSVALALVCATAYANPDGPIACEGTYAHHLQGVCADEDGGLYWCFTTQLVKTDRTGKRLKQIPVGNHHGDLCHHDGKVYVAVNFGKFNRPAGEADSWIYVYNAADLSLVAKHKTPEVVHGAGGIAYHDGTFLVVGGLPPGVEENYAYAYDEQFRFVKGHVLASGYTLMGIQTAAYADGKWWFGCYGKPQELLIADASFQQIQRVAFDASLGIVPAGSGTFLVARGRSSKEDGCTGRLIPAMADPQAGLRLRQ